MITLVIHGLDPYYLRKLSKDVTPLLSNLLEMKEDDINFFGVEGLMIHNGVEQNTWRTLIKVSLPRKVQLLQDKIVEILVHYFKSLSIHIEIIFDYYLSDERVININSEYPLYLTETNVVDDQYEDEDYEDEDVEYDDIYDGDAFENIREKLG